MRRRRRRQPRGSGPRNQLPRYKRDLKGKTLYDDAGKPIVDYIEWRGHGYLTVNGERIPSRWVTAPTRAELNRILGRMLDEDQQIIDSGNYVMDGHTPIPLTDRPTQKTIQPLGMTLNDAFIAAIESPRARRSDGTIQTYRQRWDCYVSARVHPDQTVPLGDIPMHLLSYDHLAQWDAFLTDRLSPKTFAETRNVLRTIVNFVLENTDLFPGVTVGYHPGVYEPRRKWSGTNKRKHVAAVDEYEKLVSACRELIAEDPTYGWQGMLALITLVRHCMRPSEAVALKWTDWDEATGGFWIENAAVALKGGAVLKSELKTDASRDLVVIAPNLIANIFQSQTTGSIWVVPSPADPTRWMATSSRNRRWGVLAQRAGVHPDTDLYTLKHGLITDLLAAGNSADQIMVLTRHTTTKMINEVYATARKTALSDEINKMHSE